MSFADSWYRASCALLLLTLYFSMFSFYSSPFHSLSLSLSLSPPSFSLWLQDMCHLMSFTKSYFFTPYPSIAHIKFTNYSPTIFYNTIPGAAWKTSFSLSGQPSSSFQLSKALSIYYGKIKNTCQPSIMNGWSTENIWPSIRWFLHHQIMINHH